jgi:hypothetical protein
MTDLEKILECRKLLHEINNMLTVISCSSSFYTYDRIISEELRIPLLNISKAAMKSGALVAEMQKALKDICANMGHPL